MASQVTHIAQAKHNNKLAKTLLRTLKYKDWLITISFYTAVHLVEAAFSEISEIKHTEAFVARAPSGRGETEELQRSFHFWREKLIGTHFKGIRRHYSQLKIASEQARYLETLDKPSFEFFSDKDAKKLYEEDLMKIRSTLDFQL